MPIKKIGRQHGFSDASCYKWRAKYGGMDASEAKRLRELEPENGRRKRCWPRQPGHPRPPKRLWHKALAPQVKRGAIRSMVTNHQFSEHHACALVG